MWAHTLVNDVSDGVFPAVGEILTDIDDAEIAIRHTFVDQIDAQRGKSIDVPTADRLIAFAQDLVATNG